MPRIRLYLTPFSSELSRVTWHLMAPNNFLLTVVFWLYSLEPAGTHFNYHQHSQPHMTWPVYYIWLNSNQRHHSFLWVTPWPTAERGQLVHSRDKTSGCSAVPNGAGRNYMHLLIIYNSVFSIWLSQGMLIKKTLIIFIVSHAFPSVPASRGLSQMGKWTSNDTWKRKPEVSLITSKQQLRTLLKDVKMKVWADM